MTNDTVDAKSIFLEAVEQVPSAEWPDFLRKACGSDEALLDRVQRLLEAHAASGDFMARPAAPVSAESTRESELLPERLGQTIGRYRLLEEIGEGGMGVVYRAEQQKPVHRMVALKIIKAGMDTRQVVARFEAERQALAMMDHPNIARILDAGTTGGSPKSEARGSENPKSEARNPKQIENLKSEIPNGEEPGVSDLGASDLEVVSDFGFRDSDFSPGRPYFVMELIVGGIPLTDYCDQNRLGIAARLELFLQVCQAVEHAHQKGIIHRDLKPGHVLVTLSDGVPAPKIIDFGIAKALNRKLTEKTLFTSYGQIVGTPLYMSPEQAEPGAADVDTRSDIYSLGVILYELLTGSTPLDRDRVREAGYDEIHRMIREEDPPWPSARLTQLSRSRLPGGTPAPGANTSPGPARQAGPSEPASSLAKISAQRNSTPAQLHRLLRRDLDWVVIKALAKDRTRRYPTASDFARDIQRYLADEPVEARPPTLSDRAAKWARRHRAFVWSSITLLIAASVILAISTLLVLRERSETIRQRDEVLHREAILRRQAYAADVQWAFRAWQNGEIEQARRLLARQQPAADHEDLRSFAWYYLWQSCQHPSSRTLRGHTDVVYSVAFSPDGKLLASGGRDRTIVLWDAATGKKLRVLPGHSDDVNYIAFSPDGKLMVSADEGFRDRAHPEPKVILWDPAGGRLLKTLTGFEYPVALAIFTPDGKTLVVSEVYWPKAAAKTSLWDLSSGQRRKTIEGRRALALSPDGRTLATCAAAWSIHLVDLATLAERGPLRGHTQEVLAGAFSPDGRTLATGGRDTEGRLWDVAKLQQQAVLHGHLYAIRSLAFLPGGNLLVSAGDDAQVRYWDAKSGSIGKIIVGHSDRIWSLALSQDGSTLATASSDKTVKVWDPKEVGRPVAVAPHPGPVEALAFLTDSKTLVTPGPGFEPSLAFWDADTGDWKSVLAVGERVTRVAVSHVRSLLAVGTVTGRVHLYDLADGNRLVTSLPHEQPIGLVAISPNGTHLAYQFPPAHANESPVVPRVWDLASGTDILSFQARGPLLVFSPDGKHVTIQGDDGIVRRFEFATRRLDPIPWPELPHPRCLAYTPDATTLAIGSADRSIKLYDPETGQERATLLGHRDAVSALAFSPDGRTLASGSKAGEVLLWDVVTGQQLTELHGHPGTVASLVFSPDGARLAAGGVRPDDHGEVTIWHAPRRRDGRRDEG